jgi:hypothetical protein
LASVGGGIRAKGWSAHGFVMVSELLSKSIIFVRRKNRRVKLE